MSTWAGSEATQRTISATSSATSGSATPAYTSSRLPSSPSKRTSPNSSVRTMPGAISVNRSGSATCSSRSVWVSTFTPCLAAV